MSLGLVDFEIKPGSHEQLVALYAALPGSISAKPAMPLPAPHSPITVPNMRGCLMRRPDPCGPRGSGTSAVRAPDQGRQLRRRRCRNPGGRRHGRFAQGSRARDLRVPSPGAAGSVAGGLPDPKGVR